MQGRLGLPSRRATALACGTLLTAVLVVGEPDAAPSQSATAAARPAAFAREALRDRPARLAKTPKLAATLARLRRGSVRVEILRRDGRVVVRRVPARRLRELAASPLVRSVGEPTRPELDAVHGEGVPTSGAGAWQAAGWTGAGVKVAVIDGGFGGYGDRRAAGDVPAASRVDFCAPGLFDGRLAPRHGTAVAEIVHEMAPRARLELICIDDLADLVRAKDYVVARGIQVVNHSASWFNTSRGDGTGGPGTPDAVVADARAKGILWVNSAGNRGLQHWGGAFADADGDHWHEFVGGDEGNGVTLPTAVPVCIRLKWDDWPASRQDFDLFLLGSRGGPVVASSRNPQTGTEPPTEQLCYVNPGAATRYFVAIAANGATAAPRLDLFISPGPDFEHQVAEGSITEPGSSPAALTVGAVCWLGDAFEPYSSRGPTIDGRVKPDVAAQADVSSGSFGRFAGCGGSGFAGTSAAAPHVAGAAALVKQANPAFGPAELQAFLETHATDLGVAGKDTMFGAGRLLLGEAPAGGPRLVAAAPCVVPKLRGKTLQAARASLARAHCRLGGVRGARSRGVRRGRVVSQAPRAGRKLAPGASVSVVISRGRR